MKKRDMETRKTEFLEQVIANITYMDLQGVFSDNGSFIAGFEAVDIQEDELKNLHNNGISMHEIYLKSCFCLQLGACFYLLLHKKENKTDFIYVREYKANLSLGTAELKSEYKYEENSFIQDWWDPRSGRHVQTKNYRKDMKKALSESYFDNLLKKYGRSWTFNIDGFIYDPLNKNQVLAIIENRISNKAEIEYYKPENYFYNDKRVWCALKAIADRLKVPLMLCTYSRSESSINKMGVGFVKDINSKLTFMNNISPKDNIISSISQFKRWLLEYGAPDSIFTENSKKTVIE